MPRRLLVTIAALALAASAGAAGCADTVSPAARVGDRTISHDDLMTEVEAWAGSPTLVRGLQIPIAPGTEESGYATGFVDVVLNFQVSFELHNAEFESRDLELTSSDIDDARTGLFESAETTTMVLDELGEESAQHLLEDVARLFKVQEELAEEYPAWQEEAYTQTEIEVSPRYGRWDTATGTIVAPEGPLQPVGGDQLLEL